MQICTNITCITIGVLAILTAIAIFYLIGLFITRNDQKNNKHSPVKDKEYRADRPNRLNNEDQSKLKTKPKNDDEYNKKNVFNDDEDEVI